MGSISGRVVTTAGSPIAGVEVQIYDANASLVATPTTSATGEYAAVDLTAGIYLARTRNSAGYMDEVYDDLSCMRNACRSELWMTEHGGVIEVAVGVETRGIDFALDRGGTVGGRVTDSTNGTGISDALIEIYQDYSFELVVVRQADSDGNWSMMAGLLPGDYTTPRQAESTFR